MAGNQATFSIEDFAKQKTTFQVNVGPITALNFTAVRNALDALKNATDELIRGEIRQTKITEVFTESVAAVTDPEASREGKWLVTYRDVTQFLDVGNTIVNVGFGNLYSKELGTADRSLLVPGTELIDMTLPAVQTWISAFESVENSPTGGNEIEVVKIEFVGRDL